MYCFWGYNLTARKDSRRFSAVKFASRRNEGDAVDGEIAMIGGEDDGAFMAAGEEHGAGVGVVHLGRVALHKRKHLDRRGVLDAHALDEFSKAIEGGCLIPHEVRGLGYGGTGYDEGSGAP
jgi:hypothetical protein